MILVYVSYLGLFVLAILENVFLTPGPSKNTYSWLPINLLEAAILLTITRFFGWESGLTALCFLVAMMIVSRPISRHIKPLRN